MQHRIWSLFSNLRLTKLLKRQFVVTNYIIVLLSLGCIFLLCILLLFIASFFFTIDTIIIAGERTLPFGLQILRGQNILFVKESEVAKNIKQKNFSINDVVVEKKPLSTIYIYIKGRKPTVQFIKDNMYYVVDEEGTLFSASPKAENVPIVEGFFNDIAISSHLPENLVKSIFPILSSVLAKELMITKITIVNPNEIILVGNDMYITTSAMKDGKTLSTSLQTLIQSFRIEGKKPRSIDLRFDKPIVRF